MQGPRAPADRASRPTSITSATPTACSATCRSRASASTPSHRGRASARRDVHEHGGRHNAEFVADQGGLDGQVAVRRDRRRAQRLDQPPRALASTLLGGLHDALPAARGLDHAARCSTSPSTSTPSRPASTLTSTTSCAPGWRSPCQKVGEVATLAKGLGEGREAIADRARRERPRAGRPARLAPHRATRRSATASTALTEDDATRATARSRSAGEAQQAAPRPADCSRPRRSAPSRRPPRSAQTRARSCARARSTAAELRGARCEPRSSG